MTPYEHAMLAGTGVLAAGLDRRFGWPLVAVAAVAAVSPDWDGITIALGAAAFAASHRMWGHNVWACVLSGILIGCLDYRLDLVTRAGRFLARCWHIRLPGQPPQVRESWSAVGYATWLVVAVLAAFSHLAADMAFSGSATLPEWHLQVWWPVSRVGYAYPLVPWGDVGVSIIFVAGMFAMWKWPGRLQAVSIVTLAAVGVYVWGRGT